MKAHPKLAPGIHVTLMAVIPMRPILPPDEVHDIVGSRGIRLISFQDLWNRKYGGKEP